MDFTINLYNELLTTLSVGDYKFITLEDYFNTQFDEFIILRHDVDKLPLNSLHFARIQAELGIKANYYFRIVKGNFNQSIISEIASLGHSIGYHYEDVIFATQKIKKAVKLNFPFKEVNYPPNENSEKYERYLVDIAVESFVENLEKLRKIVNVNTISMHGSPMSRWDSRLLWKYYDYHNFGIVGEPYFDINFIEARYLTDTGRRWNGGESTVRDKVKKFNEKEYDSQYSKWKVKPILGSLMNMPPNYADLSSKYGIRSTFDIVKAVKERTLPGKIMMTFHPQRWTNRPLPWMKELVWQNVKNVGKYFLINVKK